MSATTAPPRPRLVGLDLLRLGAVLLVLGRHMPDIPENLHGLSGGLLRAWQRGGWVGVDLFFVLSGFLVSGLLFAEYLNRGRISMARFYIRRSWRIYPPFLVLIAATVIVQLTFGLPLRGSAVASELLFIQNYRPGMWGHTWSLAVEEHFYLILPPALALVLARRSPTASPSRTMLAAAAFLGIVVLVLRVLSGYAHPQYSPETHLFPTHLRLDSLFFGVTLSFLYNFHRRQLTLAVRPWRWPLLLTGVGFLMPAFFLPDNSPFVWTVGLSLFYLGSGALMLGVLLLETPTRGLAAWPAAVGAYSYSIYLWHLPVRYWGIWLTGAALGAKLSFAAATLVYLVASIVFGILMAKAIEYPTLQLRDHWFPDKAGASTLGRMAPRARNDHHSGQGDS